MKAMIFAAGLGTRLRPLTNHKPKALVEVGGMPLLEIAIRRLKFFNCKEIIINVHHFAEQILDFIKRNKSFGIRIAISDERDLLLETGGGLKKAAWFFEDGQPFLICNADVLSNLDLKNFYDFHCKNGALASLATRSRNTSRYFLFDEHTHELRGWMNVKTGEVRWSNLESEVIVKRAFSGIHVVSSGIFDFMPKQEAFSIVEVYLSAARRHRILGFSHDDSIWLDVGKPQSLEKAEDALAIIPID